MVVTKDRHQTAWDPPHDVWREMDRPERIVGMRPGEVTVLSHRISSTPSIRGEVVSSLPS